jgi:chromosome segregation ATPase
LTFEVDKLTKINMDLKNSVYEAERLNETILQKNNDLANAKSTIQALERKIVQCEVVYKEVENLRHASIEVESLRDSLHKKDLEITRIKQTIVVKETQVNDSLSEREQLRKKINALEAQQ